MTATRDLKVFIEDIWESIEKIETYSSDITEKEFECNTEKQDAVIRRLEVIGEAVKNIPPEFKDKYPEIPWRKIAGMRDMVIHEYFGVSVSLVWNTAVTDIPALKHQINRIKNDLGILPGK